MKYLLALLISGALAVSGYSQTRNVLVNSNNAVVSPTNFWSVDASNARTGLGLGSAATNPASAFQPSSGVLSNLSSSNAVNLTNLRATNIVGTIPASNIPSVNLTNIPATNIVGTVALASNVTGTIAISNGGTGATSAGGARTNLGLGSTNDVTFNIVDALKITSGGVAPTYTLDIFNGSINFTTNPIISWGSEDVYFSVPIFFTSTTNAATTRTNLGLGATWLTNTVASNFRTAIGLPLAALTNTNASNFRVAIGATTIGNALFTATNSSAAIDAIGISTNFSDQVLSVSNIFIGSFPMGSGVGFVTPTSGRTLLVRGTNVTTSVPAFYGFNGFESTAFSAAEARTNLGLNAWTTNTNSPVFVSTNGEVVSPTNFWQVAPIVTRFVESKPTTNQTTNILAARNIHIHSLAISTVGVTNTIALPTNNVFNGDIALVVHEGPTSSVTAVRAAGAATNLITLNRLDEAVEFVYYNNVWQFNHNQAFIEPIYFSGTNAAANAAASRTNLGLGSTNNVAFADIEITKTGTNSVYAKNDAGAFQVQIGTNSPSFAISSSSVDIVPSIIAYSNMSVDGDINVAGAISVTNAAATRTNLGIPLAALTNTNNANFQEAIFATNAAPTNAGNFGDHAAWMGVSIVTNGVTNVFRIPLYK